MALTAAQLEAKRDSLILKLGLTAERFGERSVQYGDIQKAIAFYDTQIANASTTKPAKQVRMITGSGY